MNYEQVFTSRYSRGAWQELLHDIFSDRVCFRAEAQRLTTNSKYIDCAVQLGEIALTDKTHIAIYEVKLSSAVLLERNRSGIRNMLLTDWKGFYAGAFMICYQDNSPLLRFSYVSSTYNFDQQGNYVKTETAPRRYTYLLGEKMHCRTAVERFTRLKNSYLTLKDITDAFSVEALTKEFYNELLTWYDWITKPGSDITVTFPSDVTTIDDDQDKLGEKTIRLITRIMFVWFIKQKQLVPDNLFDAVYINGVLKDFDKDSTTNGNYYNAILQNLFFATLNCEHSDRRFTKSHGKDIKTRYRYADMFKLTEQQVVEMFSTIPYLNGGLFECLDKTARIDGEPDVFYDGFSNNATCFSDTDRPKYRAVVPNCVFFDQYRGLLPLLRRYNFTIEENSTVDQTIALDPELLGKVFENLLAVYNPETRESARKESGSFYTPREIVDYMCKEAVVAYLGEECRSFVENGNTEGIDGAILQKLKKIKIFDPACGSGAYPMGLLNLLDTLIETLEGSANRYERKLDIIQNSIYGADIQCIAVQITKLRFFISLVCEAGSDIKPLPNLETKFVAANSLIDLQGGNKQLSLFNVEDLKQQLFGVRACHFATRSVSEKVKLRGQDEALRGRLLERLSSGINDVQAKQMALWDPYDQNNNADFFNPQWMFGIDTFDIVIGNPPYVQLQKNDGKLGNLYKDKGYKVFNSMGDIYCLFYERALQLLAEKGHLCFITSNKWMRAGYGQPLRQLLSEHNPRLLIDFSGQKVFENATVDVNILLLTNSKEKGYAQCATAKSKDFTDLQWTPMTFGSESWVVMNAVEQSIKRKIEAVGTPLKEWDIEIYRGVLTGYNEAFIIDSATRAQILNNCRTTDERERTEKIIVKILRGRDIKRYSYTWAGLWLINTHNGVKGQIERIHIEDYPAVKQHLDSFGEKLLKRSDQGDTPYNLRNCAYLASFAQEKIVYPVIAQEARFCFDDREMYILDTCYMMSGNNMKYLVALLSSKLIEFVYKRFYTNIEIGVHGYKYNKYSFITLPLPLPSVDSEIAREIEALVAGTTEGDVTAEKDIDLLVYSLYNLNAQEIEFIEQQ